MEIVIGAFYQVPDGRITYICGAGYGKVHHRFDDDQGSIEVPESETETWIRRNDLRDYPNARDPRLPYVFDLHWDIKYMSQLRQELEGHEDESEIRELMKSHQIFL